MTEVNSSKKEKERSEKYWCKGHVRDVYKCRLEK